MSEAPDRHPALSALDGIGMGWLEAFAEQGFEDVAGVVQLGREPALENGGQS